MLVNTEDGAVGRKMRRQEARLPKTQIITENSKARGEAAERKKELCRVSCWDNPELILSV